MDKLTMRKYAADIKSLFPTENKEIYFSEPEGASSRGKLLSKKKNLLYKYNLLFPTREREPKIPEGQQTQNCEGLNEGEVRSTDNAESIDIAISWLSDHTEPLDEVKENWKATSLYRLQLIEGLQVNTILESWPHYSRPEGSSLVKIDFFTTFPNYDAFPHNFETLRERLPSVYEKLIRNRASRVLLKQMNQDSTTTDARDCILIILINAVLLPERQTGRKKPTIKDAQDAMVTHVTEKSKIQKADIFTASSPVIVVIGPSILEVTKILVCFKDLEYDFPCMQDAIEFCLQFCLVFKLDFNSKCACAWEFLAGFCYNPDKITEPRVQAFLTQVNT
ncbi:hypothetical protein DMENIID0001_060360 [Sergentomyia squamirostris]